MPLYLPIFAFAVYAFKMKLKNKSLPYSFCQVLFSAGFICSDLIMNPLIYLSYLCI